MERVELVLGVVLIALALLLGVLFGGSSIWFLKPSAGGEKVVEKVVNKYVCFDGSIKDAQSQCPTVSTENGQTQVVCPPCPAGNASGVVFRKCDCTQCSVECGTRPPVTTTTLLAATCKECTADSECGTASYSDMRCKNDEVYKMYLEPTCMDDKDIGKKCCKTKETYNKIMTCPGGQHCEKGKGCVTLEVLPDE